MKTVPAARARRSIPLRFPVIAAIGCVALVACAADEPVITQILGTSLKDEKMTDAALAQCVDDIAGKGFSMSWDAAPATWTRDLLNKPELIAHHRRVAKRLHAKGMGVAFGVHWVCLLPRERTEAAKSCQWMGETLNPETGGFERSNWNIGSEEARQEFIRRLRALFEALGEPAEFFFTDEIILAKPGANSHYQRISTYWTSPTFSEGALAGFREYLAERGYANAAEARFPVTTIAAPKSGRANEGLPAVPLTDANRDRLVADNDWPESDLWKHWYAWREDLYASWLGASADVACQIWGDRPEWLGCSYEAPVHWMVTGLAHNLEKIAALPHMDYVAAGYMGGDKFQRVKEVADRHGKKWGINVELCHYGKEKGIAPDTIRERFRTAVEAGASLVTCYAGSNFRTDRKDPTDKRRATGLYYMPEQIAAWADCIDWLETGRGYRRLSLK